MSRKKDLETIASFVGNAAAHVALLPGQSFALKEAATYTDDAYEIASSRKWNNREIEFFREKALQRVASELRSRIKDYGFDEKNYGKFLGISTEYVDDFIKGK